MRVVEKRLKKILEIPCGEYRSLPASGGTEIRPSVYQDIRMWGSGNLFIYDLLLIIDYFLCDLGALGG
jgi:hypothetical protein